MLILAPRVSLNTLPQCDFEKSVYNTAYSSIELVQTSIIEKIYEKIVKINKDNLNLQPNKNRPHLFLNEIGQNIYLENRLF